MNENPINNNENPFGVLPNQSKGHLMLGAAIFYLSICIVITLLVISIF